MFRNYCQNTRHVRHYLISPLSLAADVSLNHSFYASIMWVQVVTGRLIQGSTLVKFFRFSLSTEINNLNNFLLLNQRDTEIRIKVNVLPYKV
jgi:hypothetical protein